MISVNYLFENDVGEGQFKVPRIERKKEKRLNPKTNRIKTFKNIQYLFTDIPPEKRDFKNLPRYADKSPKVKFQDWLCIDCKKLQPSHSVFSWGWSPNGKCYGWSHRAVHGFEIGEKVKKGDIIYKDKEYTLETKEQVEQAAKDFAADVA